MILDFWTNVPNRKPEGLGGLVDYILIIEDHEDVNLMLAEALTDAGYKVKSSYTGIDNIQEIKNNAYDLILLDIMLPYKNGDEILKELREFSETPVIVISAKGMIGTKIDLLNLGADHADELGALIEHFFEYSYYMHAEPEPNLERINLTNLVTECLAESIADLEAKNLAVHIEETVSVFACADKEMVIRIIQNLIRNCVAHSDGDIDVQIRTTQNAVISF